MKQWKHHSRESSLKGSSSSVEMIITKCLIGIRKEKVFMNRQEKLSFSSIGKSFPCSFLAHAFSVNNGNLNGNFSKFSLALSELRKSSKIWRKITNFENKNWNFTSNNLQNKVFTIPDLSILNSAHSNNGMLSDTVVFGFTLLDTGAVLFLLIYFVSLIKKLEDYFFTTITKLICRF